MGMGHGHGAPPSVAEALREDKCSQINGRYPSIEGPCHRRFQPLVHWFSHNCMCPLLGWGAPLSNVQPHVQVERNIRAESQWLHLAAHMRIESAKTNIANSLTTEAGRIGTKNNHVCMSRKPWFGRKRSDALVSPNCTPPHFSCTVVEGDQGLATA